MAPSFSKNIYQFHSELATNVKIWDTLDFTNGM